MGMAGEFFPYRYELPAAGQLHEKLCSQPEASILNAGRASLTSLLSESAGSIIESLTVLWLYKKMSNIEYLITGLSADKNNSVSIESRCKYEKTAANRGR